MPDDLHHEDHRSAEDLLQPHELLSKPHPQPGVEIRLLLLRQQVRKFGA
jgi:hypothetical protein